MGAALAIESLVLSEITAGHGNSPLWDGISWRARAGFLYRVHGGSGSGRSTLIRLLAGLHAPLKGEYQLNGHNVYDYSFEEFLPMRLGIGFGFDMGGLLNNRTLRENLLLPLRYHKWGSEAEVQEQTNHILRLFGLEEVAEQRPSAVSGSQRKATCIARALIMDPQVLLLDDPTTGLNAKHVDVLNQEISRRMKSGQLRFAMAATDDARLGQGTPCVDLELSKRGLK